MQIRGLTEKQRDGKKTISAMILWENTARPPQEIYFEVDEWNADALVLNPHAFVVACTVPALLRGEKRISIDSPVQSELLHGLGVVMRTLRYWHRDFFPYEMPQIEAPVASGVVSAPRDRSAMFLSGGLDSLASLRVNRMTFEDSHPRYFRDGVFILGLQPEVDNNFDLVGSSLRVLAEAAQLQILPIRTNIRYLEDNWHLWLKASEGSVLAAVAHALQGRFSQVTIASSDDLSNLLPHGSHPLLDPWYGVDQMRIRHDDVTLSRLDKVRTIADWPSALNNLRVCNDPHPGKLNCERCEKCIRTMLELLAVGVLDKSQSFDLNNVTANMVNTTGPIGDLGHFPELLPAFERLDRRELCRAIQAKVSQYIWKERLTEWDRRYLGGFIARGRSVSRARKQAGLARFRVQQGQ